MGKPSWKYNPIVDGGISLASQEDEARATHEERARDDAYAGDFAAIVEALRSQRVGLSDMSDVRFSRLICLESDAPESCENDYSFFVSLWGFPALLRALARAIELETGK